MDLNKKGDGDDPRDFWHEVDLSNKEASDNEVSLQLDAYFDFCLYMPELIEPIPLNFRSIQELELFISIFKRPWNGAFSGLLDICETWLANECAKTLLSVVKQ